MKFSTIAVFLVSGVGPAMGLSSYLNQMGGGSAAKPSSYGPSRGKPQAPPGGTGIGGFSPTSNHNGYQAPPLQSGNAAPTSGDYLSQMSDGYQQASDSGPKTSYAPTKSNFKSGGSGFGGYLDGFAGPPADPEQSMVAASAPPAPTSANYLSQMGGGAPGASTGPKTSYAPTKSNFKSGGSGIGSYLDGFAGPPAAVPEDSMVANHQGNAAPSASGYLSSMGGGASTMKPSMYGPKATWKTASPAGGTGFSPGGGGAANAAPTGYLAQMGGAPAAAVSTGPKTSYAPTKSNFKSGGSGIGSYLDGFAGPPASPAESMVSEPPLQDSAPAFGNYLSTVGGGGSSMKPSSYGPSKGGKPQAPPGGNGMGGFTPGAPVSNGYEAPSAPAANAAPTSSNYLSQMGGGGGTMKKSGYGPKKNW